MENKQIMIIKFNMLFYLVFIFLIIGGLIQKIINDQYFEGFGFYIFMTIVITLITLFILLGLKYRKNWAITLAINWNIFIAFMLIALKLIGFFVLKNIYNNSISLYQYFDIDTIFRFFLGAVFIILFFLIKKGKTGENGDVFK